MARIFLAHLNIELDDNDPREDAEIIAAVKVAAEGLEEAGLHGTATVTVTLVEEI